MSFPLSRPAALAGLLAVSLAAASAWGQQENMRMFDGAKTGAAGTVSVNGNKTDDVSFDVSDKGIDVKVIANPSTGFPGVQIKPPTPLDAGSYGRVDAKITNFGTKPVRISLRLDNEGPWQENRNSASVVSVPAGKSATVSTIFGYNYGKPAYKLNGSAISSMLLFSGKSDVPQHWRIDSIEASGLPGEKPAVDPATASIKPEGGVILGGKASAISTKQLAPKAAKADVVAGGKGFSVEFTGRENQSVTLKPVAGTWNLRDHLQVRVAVKNTGSSPVTPSVRLDSRGGSGEAIAAAKPVEPGQTAEIVVPFRASKPWEGVDLPEMRDQQGPKRGFKEFKPGTGTQYASNTTNGVTILAEGSGKLEVTSIVADMPPQEKLPDWLGKKPPVEGDWKVTLDENFDGSSINNNLWNNYTEGEWHLGKATGYSKDNVIVKDGKLVLRVERRRVHHNDNPAYPIHEYATGHADTYGKWTQRYGYFEARLKMPSSQNSFTAFWLMPDRGLEYDKTKATAYGEHRNFQRNSTNGFGMEFDIQEQLSIWGPNRTDFGMHWDHYMAHHKTTGTFGCYFQPDAEGYLTIGMLWEPGRVVMYQQGRESARWETDRIGKLPSYVILQHITGGWETEGPDDAQLPSDFLFDYVRVWQRADLASDVDGPKPNDGGLQAPK